jgi:phage terminase large subunit
VVYGLKPVLVPNQPKQDGINTARQTLKRCVFHPRCEEVGISALEQYRRDWDDERKTFRASEIHDWTSHLADAFRYLSIAWRSAPREPVKYEPPQPRGTVILEGAPKPQKARLKV